MNRWLERILIAAVLVVVAPVVLAQSMVLEDGGVAFPDGSVQSLAASESGERFEKNGDGTVTDTYTGLIWLEDANCANALFFFDAGLAFANTLADGSTSHGGGDCNLSDGSMVGDWRVPNMFEALSILDYHYFAREGSPFTNVQVKYWTSTFNPQNKSFAHTWWTTSWGFVSTDWKENTNQYYVWPVKGTASAASAAGEASLTLADGGIEFPDGSVQSTAASPTKVVPKTGQVSCYDKNQILITCAGTGQDGDHRAGLAWPIPRFTKNGDGTVTDNVTGFIWLEKANCFGAQTWANALAKASGLFDGSTNDGSGGDCSLTDGSLLGDWRLSTLTEFQGLAYMESDNPALPNTAGTGQWVNNDPFIDLPIGESYWWTSQGTAIAGTHAFIGFPRSQTGGSAEKTNGCCYAWPVKDPN